jgi:hypothetical protein
MAAKKKPTLKDRVAEYVDSPLMTHRLRHGDEVSARIVGNYGVYRTCVTIHGECDQSCTCPSEERPCKHVLALEETWEEVPETFFDLDDLLTTLAKRSKTDLIDLIAEMAAAAPETLAALGVEGFEPVREDDEWYD